MKFMKDPLNTEPEPSKPPSPSPEEHWSDVTGNQNIVFPSADNFDSFLKGHNSVLVMFYAPCKYLWTSCGKSSYSKHLFSSVLVFDNLLLRAFFSVTICFKYRTKLKQILEKKFQ